MDEEPRHNVDSNEIVVDMDWIVERPVSAPGDFVAIACTVSCDPLVDVDGAGGPAALLNRFNNSFTKPEQ